VSQLRLAIKVDVDTYAGLRDGVPALARAFTRFGIRASVFVSCGPDHTGRAIRRMFRPGFLGKMRRTGSVGTYGWRTMLYGTLLPGPQIARSFPDVIRKLRDDGHEVGVHGYDHVYWQDRLPRLDESQVAAELRRGQEVLGDLLGAPPPSFAAPGWQCTPISFACEDAAGFRYHSDTRGTHPFLPRMAGRDFRLPEIPTTLPTLDEAYGRCGTTAKELTPHYRSQLRDGLNVHTVHAEMEGMRYLDLFVDLLESLQGEATYVRLIDEVETLPSSLPRVRVAMRPIPGRSGTVACQEVAE
jgi:undecaprenyl phosphate-alpha-L-ara4FN deformylase